MVKKIGKKGDTLVEVMLAVGIFSMVAIAVVAVMIGGTSSAQTALETTLAREEIDAQAEALRFIQTSYVSDKNSGVENGKYEKLWKDIISKAYNASSLTIDPNLAQFSPSACSELYTSDGEAKKHGFVINTKKLGEKLESESKIKNFIVGSNKLREASTYPHLIFGKSTTDNSDQEGLAENKPSSDLWYAEGIYIIAVKDPNSTKISDSGSTSAYYDFYIRTCWYGTGDQAPSTISTVMRLYDPKAIDKDSD